jgi:hypothetical protein
MRLQLSLSVRELHDFETVSDLPLLTADLAHLAPMLLPPDARALTLETFRALCTVRVYLHGPGSITRWADLDAALTPLAERRLPAGQAWEVVVQAIRQDRPAPVTVFGTVLWVEEGTVVVEQAAHTPRQ